MFINQALKLSTEFRPRSRENKKSFYEKERPKSPGNNFVRLESRGNDSPNFVRPESRGNQNLSNDGFRPPSRGNNFKDSRLKSSIFNRTASYSSFNASGRPRSPTRKIMSASKRSPLGTSRKSPMSTSRESFLDDDDFSPKTTKNLTSEQIFGAFYNNIWEYDTVDLPKLFSPDMFICPPSPCLDDLCCLFIRFFNERKNDHQFALFIKDKRDLQVSRQIPTHRLAALKLFCSKYKRRVSSCIAFSIIDGVLVRSSSLEMHDGGCDVPISDVLYEQFLWILEENGIYALRDDDTERRETVNQCLRSLNPKLRTIVVLPKIMDGSGTPFKTTGLAQSQSTSFKTQQPQQSQFTLKHQQSQMSNS